MPPRPLKPGVYAATLTFFKPKTEELDVPTIRKHAIRLVKAGLVGLVTLGSNGEAPHLNREERKIVTRETRSALDEAGFTSKPIIVGASDPSVRGTLALIHDAASSGGDYVLVLPPSYFVGAMTTSTMLKYYTDVADASPLPIILYSFPAVSAGIQMDSDFLIRASAHPNIVGTKFTCGDTGKLARVAAAMNAATPQSPNSNYVAFGGLADFGLQAMVAGGSGFIAGGANVTPKACVRVYDLFAQGKIAEAMQLQTMLSIGDWPHTRTGIAGTKSAMQSHFGYGGLPRRPLQDISTEAIKILEEEMAHLMAWEKSQL